MKILAKLQETSSYPFKALLPAFIGFMMLMMKRVLQKLFSLSSFINNESHLSSYHSQRELLWLIEPISEAFESIGEAIFASYNNYFTFILMMLLVSAILHWLKGIKRSPSIKEEQKKNISAQNSADNNKRRKQFLRSFLKSLLIYSLVYCFYQVMRSSTFGQKANRLDAPQHYAVEETTPISMPGRILEERSLTDEPKKKPSLSIGKVMSEINICAYSTRLSKDKKTIFVVANTPAALQILDISDPEYPVILSSLPLVKGFADVIYKSMVISPDETKIYISNFEYLEVIDISDFKSPSYLARVKDGIIFQPSMDYRIDGVSEPNLLFSRNGQFLFVSGFGLQIFDISKRGAPVLTRSLRSREDSGLLVPSSIALSKDGKTLYYTDGGLWIYNIEDPKDLRLINSFNATRNLISSMILSKDYKTAFVLSLDEESNMVVQKLDISDIYSIKEGEIIELDQESTFNPVFLNQTPDNIFLLIRFTPSEEEVLQKLVVFDTQEKQVLDDEKSFISDNALSVLFTEDYKKVFIGINGKLKIVELYSNFPNKNAFSNSSNILQTLNTQMEFWKASFAPSNENMLYTVSQGNSSSTTRFGMHKISAGFDQLTNLSFYESEDKIEQIVVYQDNQKAFLVGLKAVYILNISNPENITLMGKYGEEGLLAGFIVSRNGTTGFLVQTFSDKRYLEIIDFSAPKSPKRKSFVNMNEEDGGAVKAVLSKDERTVFIASRKISVYNVSDHSSPALLAQLPLLVNDFFVSSDPELALSPDGNTLFLKDPSATSSSLVRIIDVSDVASPQIRSEFRFPSSKSGLDLDAEFFAISQDSRTFYVLRKSRLMAIDVSNVSSPRYLGTIRIQVESGDLILAFKLSNDGRKVYFFTKNRKCHIASLEPVYTTFVKQDTLMLGERYSLDLQVLKMDKNMNYNQIEGEYRFTKFAIVEPHSIGNPNFENVVLKPAPSWMSVDLKSQALTVESKRKNDIGTYRLYYAFSTKLPKDTFSRLNDTEDLFATLLALGYVDNQLFLTENVGEYENFILPVQYSYVKREIYQILKQYFFETFNEINLVQSLDIITGNDKLKISTASASNLKVEIHLEGGGGGGGQAKFLSRYYGSLLPTITNEKSRLVLEGSLKDINNALQEVVIHSKNTELIDGEISVSDRMNPIMAINVKNISRYFNHNLPPGRNETFPLTIQNQVDKELVYTGRYFQIKMNQQAFSDKYTEVENLNYHMVFVQDNNETALPNWLSFSDMTLMGTPPEILVGRDFGLMLIVKNEFQELKEPIRLHVKISSSFVLTLLLRYSPYVLTVLGLYIKANMIYNILGKKRYKHSKDFYVAAGEEITPEVIFPISFISEERREAKKILKFLEKKIGNKEKLLRYFLAHGEKKLEIVKISETIKGILNDLSYSEQEGLDFYLNGHYAETRIVDQIIFNTLTMERLLSKNEKETRIYFEEIKQKWPELVLWDLENTCFKINDKRFEKVLLQRNRSDTEKETTTTSLIDKSNINSDLLKDAILAFAFDCHNINSSPASVKFKVKEKRKGNWVKSFLKMDLKSSPFTEKGKIGYGMGYNKEYNTLFFDGIVKSDLKRKTIVFQVRNGQQKILKELWIIGKGSCYENESDAKGKEYQIL